ANRTGFQDTNPEGDTSTLVFNPFRKETTFLDQRGFATRHAYDENGYEVRTTFPDGSRESFVWQQRQVVAHTDALGQTETFQYDVLGNLTRKVDFAGNVTDFTYETTFSRPTSVTEPGNRTTSFSYDAHGNLIEITDSLGN